MLEHFIPPVGNFAGCGEIEIFYWREGKCIAMLNSCRASGKAGEGMTLGL
jgi:hypothetical protein